MRDIAYRPVSNWNSTLAGLLLLCVFLGLCISLSASPVKDLAKPEFANARRDDQILSLVQAWLPQMVDEEDYRYIQGQWGWVDREAMQAWFHQRHLANPNDPMFHYLWLRTLDHWDEALDGAEAIINAHPDYYWAYRLLASEFSSMLSISRASFGGHLAREKRAAKDSSYVELFLQGERFFASDPYILSALGDYYAGRGEWALLEATTLKLAQSSEPFMANGLIYQLCRYKDADPARRILPAYVSNSIRLNKFPPQDSLKIYNAALMTALHAAEDWPALDSLLASDSNLVKNRDYPYVALPMLLNRGRVPEAIELAKDLVLRGYDLNSMGVYSDLDPDFEDTRWDEFEDRVPEYEELARQREKEEFEQQRLRQQLPELDIQDANAEPLKLSDYLGQTLHLIFWTSWNQRERGQLQVYLEESVRDSSGVVTLLVNGYDSDPNRAQTAQKELGSGMPYFRIDDASLERLGIKYLPAVIEIGPDGLLDYVNDGTDLRFWWERYPSN